MKHLSAMRNRVDASASRLLIDEAPIAVSRSLALALGLEEATLLQQLHFRSVCGQSDGKRRWIVREDDGKNWVSWTPTGMLEDIPLGKTLAPHRRALAELRAAGIVIVSQLAKATWNRANFYRIDYEALNNVLQQTPSSSGTYLPPDIAKSNARDEEIECFEDSNINASNNSNGVTLSLKEEKEKKEQRERRSLSEESSSDLSKGSLRDRMRRLVGKGPKDNQEWDERRIDAILSAVERGELSTAEVGAILDDAEVCYVSQLHKRVDELAKRQQRDRLRIQAQAKRDLDQRLASMAAEATRAVEAEVSSKLVAATPEELETLAEQVATALPIASLARAAREAIASRTLGDGIVRPLILATIRGGSFANDSAGHGRSPPKVPEN